MVNERLENLRGEVYKEELIESKILKDPFQQFKLWLNKALDDNIVHANAMTFATVNKEGIPSARIVLLKEVDEKGFVFFTNYQSNKAKEIEYNSNAALLFFWKEYERQVRIEGKIEKINKEESQEYFISRPFENKVGAWVSKQSSIIPSREYLEKKYDEFKSKFIDENVPIPENWGGYRLLPNSFEFWQGRVKRLHDRLKFEKIKNGWNLFRLSP